MYDLHMSCLVAVYSDSIYKLLPQNVEDVEFDVHVRRGGGVANIRRGEIRIVLQLFLKSTSFVLPLCQCTVFKVVKVNIVIVLGEAYFFNNLVLPFN